jgi:hypothetical protein
MTRQVLPHWRGRGGRILFHMIDRNEPMSVALAQVVMASRRLVDAKSKLNPGPDGEADLVALNEFGDAVRAVADSHERVDQLLADGY